MSREILKVENLSMRFGGLLAVNGVAQQLLTAYEKIDVAQVMSIRQPKISAPLKGQSRDVK